jgi:hypothetical protein
MKGFVLGSAEGMEMQKDFDEWIGLCLDFNDRAISSKKKKPTGKSR